MKQTITFLLVLALGISIITGCGGSSSKSGPNTDPNSPGSSNPPDSSNPPGSKIVVTVIAGISTLNPDFRDGTGNNARFWWPSGIAIDKQTGILYVTDHHTIRRLTPTTDGYAVKTIAGNANVPDMANGEGSVAGFNSPNGIALGPDGWIYVADTGNNNTIGTVEYPKGSGEYWMRGDYVSGVTDNCYINPKSILEVAHCNSNSTIAVKSKKANKLGVYDMNGNVWEWSFNWITKWHAVSPQEIGRTCRGGCFGNECTDSGFSDYLRLAQNALVSPWLYDYGTGFRFVKNE